MRPIPANIYDLIRKTIRKGSNALLVSLLNYLYEAQDTALCRYVGEQLHDRLSRELPANRDKRDNASFSFSDLDFSDKSLLPQDCLSIGYFLAFIAVSYKGKFTVHLTSCSLGDTGIKILMQLEVFAGTCILTEK